MAMNGSSYCLLAYSLLPPFNATMLPMFSPRSILVFLPNWVGDVVMATPALRGLRDAFDSAEITYFGRAVPLALLTGGEWFDVTITDESAPKGGLRGFLTAWRRLRRLQPELAVLLPNSFRVAALGWLGGARRRVGYNRDGRGGLLSDKLAPPRDERGKLRPYPAMDYYIDLVESLGVKVASRDMHLPCETALGEAELVKSGYDPSRPLVMLNPAAANNPSKKWPLERFSAVGDALVERTDAQIIVNASPSERSDVAAIGKLMRHKPLINFAERDNSIPLLKSLVRRCDLLVTNDTGARHVAAAMGIGVVTIFISTDPVWARIDYPKERIVSVNVPFVPCKPGSEEHRRCTEGVTVEMVLDAAMELLSGEPSGKEHP